MIGGADMYMPLCRECHGRESRLNKHIAYEGDPSVTCVEIEEKVPRHDISNRKQIKVVKTPQSVATTVTLQSNSPEHITSFSTSSGKGMQESLRIKDNTRNKNGSKDLLASDSPGSDEE